MKILALSGSLRRESFNTALARAARELAPDGVEIEIYDGLGLLPHYDQDLDHEDLESGTSRGCSNEFLSDTARVALDEGTLLCILPDPV